MRKSAFEPCIPTPGTKVPDRPDWIHEIKHDGYRLIVQREGKRVRLFTRNGHDWSQRIRSSSRPRSEIGTRHSSSTEKPCCWALTGCPISTGFTAASTITSCDGRACSYGLDAGAMVARSTLPPDRRLPLPFALELTLAPLRVAS